MTTSPLIERHFADGLGKEEAQRLDAAVVCDPAAALALVQAAQMEQLLRHRCASDSRPDGLARWRKSTSMRRSPGVGNARRLRPAFAAALLAMGLLAAGAWWMTGRNHSAPVAPPHQADRPPSGRSLAVIDSPAPPPRLAAGDPDRESPAMTALRSQMANYFLTDVSLSQSTSLATALQRLLGRARELNHLRRPSIDALTAEYVTDPSAASSPSVVLPLSNVSLLDALKWLAVQSRSELFLKEPGIITFRPWKVGEEGAFVTEFFRVPPDFLRQGRPGLPPHDPFTPEPPLTSEEYLQSWGFQFAGEATASFDPVTSQLKVCHSETTLRQIKELLTIENSGVSTMISISTKLFEFADGHAVENRLIDADAYPEWLREQNGKRDVGLLTAPQVTTRSQQEAMVEVMKDVAHEGEMDWQGARITVKAALEGEVIRITGAADVRRPAGLAPGKLLSESNRPIGELVTKAADFEAIVPEGQTALFSLSDSPDGPHILAAMTVHRFPQ